MTEDGITSHDPNVETWNRGDGQPEPRLLDEALDRILQACKPAEVILFGSAARSELQDDSDIDLLIVENGLSNDRDTGRLVGDAIKHLPRADVMTATRTEIREAERNLSRIHRTIATEGVTLYRNQLRLPYLPRREPTSRSNTWRRATPAPKTRIPTLGDDGASRLTDVVGSVNFDGLDFKASET